MRDVKRGGFPQTTSSSSKRGRFHWYTCEIVIHSEEEHRDHSNSKTRRLEVVCNCGAVRAPRHPRVSGAIRGHTSPCDVAYSSMPDDQHQQPFVGSVLQPSPASKSGAGRLDGARGRPGLCVYIVYTFVTCCSLVFHRFPLVFGKERVSVEEEDEEWPGLAPSARAPRLVPHLLIVVSKPIIRLSILWYAEMSLQESQHKRSHRYLPTRNILPARRFGQMGPKCRPKWIFYPPPQ